MTLSGWWRDLLSPSFGGYLYFKCQFHVIEAAKWLGQFNWVWSGTFGHVQINAKYRVSFIPRMNLVMKLVFSILLVIHRSYSGCDQACRKWFKTRMSWVMKLVFSIWLVIHRSHSGCDQACRKWIKTRVSDIPRLSWDMKLIFCMLLGFQK